MIPLIDADILRYEIGHSAQPTIDGEVTPLEFDRVAHLLDEKIRVICEEVGATAPPILFLTPDRHISRMLKREFKPNFREAMAVTKPYKGTRKAEKPFHFANITAYMLFNYQCEIADGMEADDLMGVFQTYGCPDILPDESIICSRDKDLRMVEGWQYSWECGKQGAKGPHYVEGIGSLESKNGKVTGYGKKFFYYQCLAGDSVDNIGGARGVGPVKAFKYIESFEPKERALFDGVCEVYKDIHGEGWKTYLKEQINLLWMVREIKDGKPVLFKPPKGN